MSTMPAREPKPDRPEPLYPKLQPRRNGPGREQVARDQRARLHGATIEALSTYGYATTTVAHLIALAGVSRLTFYEHFDSKEACFLASYDKIVARATERILASYNSGQEGVPRVLAAYETFVSALAENPTEAKLVMVEALAVGPAALARAEHARLAFERMGNESIGGLLGVATPPEIVLRGIFGGIWQVARRRLLTDRLGELPALGGELLLWAASYNSPAAARLGQASASASAAPALEIRPRPHASRDGRDEHKRILRAAATLAARDGYAELNSARIIQEADVPDERFFERFQDSEQCFLEALQLLVVETLAKALAQARTAEDWPTAIQLSIEAILNHIASDRTFARVAFIEVFGTGGTGISVREELLRRTAELFTRYAPQKGRPSGVVAEAIVGAVWTIAFDRVVQDVAHELPTLAGYASYMALAPVLGAEAAVEAILAAS